MKTITKKFEVKIKFFQSNAASKRVKQKLWVVVKDDDNHENIGTVASCGLPAKAKDLPVGSTFETILLINW